MANFEKVGAATGPRTELHEKLHLTGAEISINNLPAGGNVPFIHHHKKNEEIYLLQVLDMLLLMELKLNLLLEIG